MEFGLWFEPEMVNLDSDLARAHPEWLFGTDHGPGVASRHQHVLDLGHPEAYAHVLERISALVDGVRHRLHQVGPQPGPGRRRARGPTGDPGSTCRPRRSTG